MEMKINANLAQQLSSPNPFTLVTSADDSKTNVMALSWWTYCSNHPLTVAICIGKHSYSGQCIVKNKQFCLCLPGEKIAAAAFAAGTCSGASVDKVAHLGLSMAPATTVAPAYVVESRLVLECKVQQSLDVNDHRMFIAAVSAMHVDESIKNLMAVNGYSALAPVEARF